MTAGGSYDGTGLKTWERGSQQWQVHEQRGTLTTQGPHEHTLSSSLSRASSSSVPGTVLLSPLRFGEDSSWVRRKSHYCKCPEWGAEQHGGLCVLP